MKALTYIVMMFVSFLLLAGLSSLPQIDECLLAGHEVQLSGKIGRETFPGRPNYESIQEGDEPETYWILTTDKPYCGKGYHYESKNLYRIEGTSRRFQLVFKQGQYNKQRNLFDKKVMVKGQMFVGNTGHHHTKMLIDVTSIEAAQ